MAQRAATASWNDADILEHHEEMVNLLFEALRKSHLDTNTLT